MLWLLPEIPHFDYQATQLDGDDDDDDTSN